MSGYRTLNRFNRLQLKKDLHTGVCWSKASKKWKSSITINKVYKTLGFFTDEYQAHLTYQKALLEIS